MRTLYTLARRTARSPPVHHCGAALHGVMSLHGATYVVFVIERLQCNLQHTYSWSRRGAPLVPGALLTSIFTAGCDFGSSRLLGTPAEFRPGMQARRASVDHLCAQYVTWMTTRRHHTPQTSCIRQCAVAASKTRPCIFIIGNSSSRHNELLRHHVACMRDSSRVYIHMIHGVVRCTIIHGCKTNNHCDRLQSFNHTML